MLSLSTLFSPSKYGLNDSAIISTRLHQFSCFLLTFIDDEAFLFSLHTAFLCHHQIGNQQSHHLIVTHLSNFFGHSVELLLSHLLLICSRWEKFLIVLIVLIFLLNMEDKPTSIGGLESILFLNAHDKQLLNVPIFWLSVLIDMKSRKVFGNRLQHQQSDTNNERIWKRHVHCFKLVCHVAHF